MEKMSKKAVLLAKQLREYAGGLTAKDLQATYIDIYPLIERKYVRVTSMYGIAIYVLTESGLEWIDNYATGQAPARPPGRQPKSRT